MVALVVVLLVTTAMLWTTWCPDEIIFGRHIPRRKSPRLYRVDIMKFTEKPIALQSSYTSVHYNKVVISNPLFQPVVFVRLSICASLMMVFDISLLFSFALLSLWVSFLIFDGCLCLPPQSHSLLPKPITKCASATLSFFHLLV